MHSHCSFLTLGIKLGVFVVMTSCGLYTLTEEQNSTPLAANAFDEDVVAAKREHACVRARALACLRSAQYQRGGVLLLGASLAACIQKKNNPQEMENGLPVLKLVLRSDGLKRCIFCTRPGSRCCRCLSSF